ncbi:uncharacterized protein TNCV_92271 [Trichonephila clavipes]|nr:uncharacterized protein TNCV_92271 [Trichonephila clavipes]
MDDNARPHRTLAVEELLESEDITRMDWPAYSPDLNPIEHVWDALGRRIAARLHHPENTQQLKQMLIEEWALLPQEMLHQLVLRMRRRQRTHILGGNHGYTPEIMDEILTTARDLELEVNEDDIEKLIMGHEDELTTEELQEILNEKHQETQQNVSPEQKEDERGPMPSSAVKDLLKKWADVRAMVLEWHPNQADVSRDGDLYNNNAINYFWKILKKREKQSTLDMFFNAP